MWFDNDYRGIKRGVTRIVLCIVISFVSFSCSKAQQKIDPEKTLIVYLSRTNNTRAIAEMIKQNVGGELIALELKKPYPENYKSIVEQVAKENEEGFLPSLKTIIDSIDKIQCCVYWISYMGYAVTSPHKKFFKGL